MRSEHLGLTLYVKSIMKEFVIKLVMSYFNIAQLNELICKVKLPKEMKPNFT